MANRRDPDIDDDFSELYKEYTGPLGSNATNVQEKGKTNKRSHGSSDEDEEPHDPNAVPTGFTSREAKLWEAKAKATERNWNKKKEEEMICKICGESGHFTQGCPSTLGANRKSQDFFERIPAREKHVKGLLTEKVIQKIEKDIGCKIKVEEKFIIVSGKDRLILKKGLDAVHKVKEEGENKGSFSSQTSRSRSPEQKIPCSSRFGRFDPHRSLPSPHNSSQFQQRFGRQDMAVVVSQMSRSRSPERRSPLSSRFGRSDSQRSLPSPRSSSQFQHWSGRQDSVVEDLVREDLQKLTRSSPQAYGNDGAGGHSSHSISPACPLYVGNSYSSCDNHGQSVGAYRTDGWDTLRRGSHMQSGRIFEHPASLQTLEELELEYKRETMELERSRDNEEDEEKCKHHEVVKETRENYMKKLAILRGTHAKQREEFRQLDAQRSQQWAPQKISVSGYGGYKQHSYTKHDNFVSNAHYTGTNMPTDSRGTFQNHMDNYGSSRPHDTNDHFQHPRHEDYGKTYNRYKLA